MAIGPGIQQAGEMATDVTRGRPEDGFVTSLHSQVTGVWHDEIINILNV